MNKHNARPGNPSLSDRDLAALRFIGEGYEVAQYQLHEAVFRGRVPTVVSRFVVRAAEERLIVLERQGQTGINRIRLTARGRAYLLERGFAHEDELFVPKAPVSAKDLAHTLWINDLRVAMNQLSPKPDLALPAWTLQRRLQPPPLAIPDVLAIWRDAATHSGLAVACEIDLGGEGLQVFGPKLRSLFATMENWASPSLGLVVVLCRGARRIDSIRNSIRMFTTRHVGFQANVLPTEGGTERIASLRSMLNESTRIVLDPEAPFLRVSRSLVP